MLLVASSFQAGTQWHSSVSDNNNFSAEQTPGSGYGYRAYGELSHFVYCILQKIKTSESLPLVEKWEDYMLLNHSSFAAIADEHFLVGTRIHAALEKMSSSYLRKEFRTSARRFLDEFCSTILSEQNWDRESAVSALKSFLEAMTIPPFSCSDSCWMGLWSVVGRRVPTLRLAKLSFSRLSGSSASWNVIPRGSVLM